MYIYIYIEREYLFQQVNSLLTILLSNSRAITQVKCLCACARIVYNV